MMIEKDMIGDRSNQKDGASYVSATQPVRAGQTTRIDTPGGTIRHRVPARSRTELDAPDQLTRSNDIETWIHSGSHDCSQPNRKPEGIRRGSESRAASSAALHGRCDSSGAGLFLPTPHPAPDDGIALKGPKMDRAPTIKGRLTQDDDLPIRGARIMARSIDGDLCGSAVTDKHGLFSLALTCLTSGDPAQTDGLMFEIGDALGDVLDVMPENFARMSQGTIELRISVETAKRLVRIPESEDEPFDNAAMSAELDRMLLASGAGTPDTSQEERRNRSA